MEEKKYQQCAGPGCTVMIEQVENGRGHRLRIYHHKNCCMAAIRKRQRLAEAEAERQRLAELVRMEKETLRKRFAGISEESIDLLYQLRHDYHLQSQVGKALMAERLTPVPPMAENYYDCAECGETHKKGETCATNEEEDQDA